MSALTRMGALGAAVVLAAGLGLERDPSRSAPVPDRTAAVTATQLAAASAAVVPHPRVPSRLPAEPAPPVVDPGTLPQTRVLPTTDDPAFQARLHALWLGVVRDDPALARPFFFPKTAYVQLKALANAAGDYDYRLLAYFDLDVHAAHRLLGAAASRAQLVGMEVPGSRAEWMWPGSEENKLSYYRVYGSRVTYTVDGKRHSFGVFSMLSWRGQWYAVHFGPWPRWERYGDVYQAR